MIQSTAKNLSEQISNQGKIIIFVVLIDYKSHITLPEIEFILITNSC